MAKESHIMHLRTMCLLCRQIGHGGHLGWSENTNLVEDVEIWLPVTFCWILLSGFIGKVENFSSNRTLGWPSWFSDPPEKHKLCREHWVLVSFQVKTNSIQGFKWKTRKCFSQSEARWPSWFYDRPDKHKLRRGCWVLASYQVSFNYD